MQITSSQERTPCCCRQSGIAVSLPQRVLWCIARSQGSAAATQAAFHMRDTAGRQEQSLHAGQTEQPMACRSGGKRRAAVDHTLLPAAGDACGQKGRLACRCCLQLLSPDLTWRQAAPPRHRGPALVCDARACLPTRRLAQCWTLGGSAIREINGDVTAWQAITFQGDGTERCRCARCGRSCRSAL